MNDKIAIYLRLSLADGDLKKGSKDESNSIENQRILLHDYIGKQEDLFGEIVEYVDDGYTGTNFNRPAFQKMIVDLKQGDIKVIMVKDLSRLGRDYIGVGDYIEQIFPLMGVRFIAVNNSFDSMKLNNGTPGIEVAVSNLVNNMYSRDIAKKIRATLETNWKNGKATCTNVPFGYVWNKKGGQRWEIDPEAAPCVKKVFELALSGRNTTQIAYGMNELNLPTPGLYAKRKNLLMGSNPIIAPDSEMLWNAAIVWRILRRYEYTGALVMGRRKKIDVNNRRSNIPPNRESDKDGVVFVHVIALDGDGRARGGIAHFDGAAGFLVHPVQIGLGVRNFRLNLKNVCTNSIGKIFSNLCGNAAGGEVSNKSFAHDKCTSFDRFSWFKYSTLNREHQVRLSGRMC